MSTTIRVSDEAEQYFNNRQKDGEDLVDTIDRLLGINGESLEEEIRRIARAEAEEVVEEMKQSRY